MFLIRGIVKYSQDNYCPPSSGRIAFKNVLPILSHYILEMVKVEKQYHSSAGTQKPTAVIITSHLNHVSEVLTS